MMQSCASAAKLRGSGPILNRGSKAMVQHRVTATSVVICSSVVAGEPVELQSCFVVRQLSRRRAKLEPFRRFAGGGEPPQRR